MDPVTFALGAKAVGGAASAFSVLGEAKAEKQNSEINAYIGRTRAMQTDTTSRQNLGSELGSIRAALGANGEVPGVGSFEVMQELRDTRNRERRIEFGNEMQSVYDHRRKGANAMKLGRLGFAAQLAKAAPSMFDLYQSVGG
ncbi:MAG: hypothetical protein GYB53_18075 [Rhodobacteraceae bacterium]|nr:hypothetical protein [Paracoccaceae bacterium]MBR9823015.1 hypothetical protein [Paracoccaceae bacterium]